MLSVKVLFIAFSLFVLIQANAAPNNEKVVPPAAYVPSAAWGFPYQPHTGPIFGNECLKIEEYSYPNQQYGHGLKPYNPTSHCAPKIKQQ